MTVNLNFAPFRIDAPDPTAAFLAGFNAFLTANGYPTLPAVGDPIIIDKVRMDFVGPFQLPNGFWHVNAMATPLPNAPFALAQALMDTLAAQIDAWFGGDQTNSGTNFPVCPDLATYTSPIAPNQQWPSDHANGIVFINPPPLTRQWC